MLTCEQGVPVAAICMDVRRVVVAGSDEDSLAGLGRPEKPEGPIELQLLSSDGRREASFGDDNGGRMSATDF